MCAWSSVACCKCKHISNSLQLRFVDLNRYTELLVVKPCLSRCRVLKIVAIEIFEAWLLKFAICHFSNTDMFYQFWYFSLEIVSYVRIFQQLSYHFIVVYVESRLMNHARELMEGSVLTVKAKNMM